MTTTTFNVDSTQFAYTLRRIGGFTSRKADDPDLQYVRIFLHNNLVICEATDRLRILIRKTAALHVDGEPFDVLIHHKKITDLLRCMNSQNSHFVVTDESFVLQAENGDQEIPVSATRYSRWPNLHGHFCGLKPASFTNSQIIFPTRALSLATKGAHTKHSISLWATDTEAQKRFLFSTDEDEIGLIMPRRFPREKHPLAGWEWLGEDR